MGGRRRLCGRATDLPPDWVTHHGERQTWRRLPPISTVLAQSGRPSNRVFLEVVSRAVSVRVVDCEDHLANHDLTGIPIKRLVFVTRAAGLRFPMSGSIADDPGLGDERPRGCCDRPTRGSIRRAVTRSAESAELAVLVDSPVDRRQAGAGQASTRYRHRRDTERPPAALRGTHRRARSTMRGVPERCRRVVGGRAADRRMPGVPRARRSRRRSDGTRQSAGVPKGVLVGTVAETL